MAEDDAISAACLLQRVGEDGQSVVAPLLGDGSDQLPDGSIVPGQLGGINSLLRGDHIESQLTAANLDEFERDVTDDDAFVRPTGHYPHGWVSLPGDRTQL